MKVGQANLPLHYGKTPRWLFSRMVHLGREIVLAIIGEHGTEEFLKRLSDPFWFQSFGCVLGFDWHSSGLTTTVCGAIKEGVKGLERDLGLFVAGGKGAASRKTPQEIEQFADRYSVDGNINSLIYASRMSAKVDNTALQDGYQLYHHTFIFSKSGAWAVIQQGMNTDTRWARRYHWLSTHSTDFVCEPHTGISCDYRTDVLNMVARESQRSRETSCEITRERPIKTVAELKKIRNLNLPERHSLTLRHLDKNNLSRVLLRVYENQPQDFESLLGIRGVGPRTIRALALISELVYEAPASHRDPAKYSFAHGGKDGYPYPVDKKTYKDSIEFLNKMISEAKIGNKDKMEAFRRLKDYSKKQTTDHRPQTTD